MAAILKMTSRDMVTNANAGFVIRDQEKFWFDRFSILACKRV